MNKTEIEQALRDYMWMMNEIIREREEMQHISGGNMIAQITDMPKGSGTTGDPVANEAIRRADKSKRIIKLEKKVLFIQTHSKWIKDEREIAVLNLMLDGLSMKAIGNIMGLSRRHIYNIKESIVDKIAHFAHCSHMLQEEKQSC